MRRLILPIVLLSASLSFLSGCKPQEVAQAPASQGLPVQTLAVSLAPVAQSSEYEATIKSRRSVTLMPQVSGNLTQLLVKSGDHVKAGQVLMTVNPLQQRALVEAQKSTENQKKALYDYNTIEIERQRKILSHATVDPGRCHDLAGRSHCLYSNWTVDVVRTSDLKMDCARSFRGAALQRKLPVYAYCYA